MSLCVTLCCFVSLCVTLCCFVSLCVAVCHSVSLCVAVCRCVSLCVAVLGRGLSFSIASYLNIINNIITYRYGVDD